MKKIFPVLILTILFLIPLLAIVSADSAPYIRVTLLNQDPDPVEQGDVVEVRFKIENEGAQTLEQIEIEVLPKYPFTLYSGEAIRPIGKLRGGQTGADAIIVDYKLKVDSNAVEGDTEIELVIRLGGVEFSYTQDEFMIDIDDYTTPDIKAYLIQNNAIEENSKGTVTLEIANVDVTDIKFLQLILMPSEDYELLSSSNYVYLGDIDSDDTDSEEFEIFIKNLDDNQVSFPIKLIYQDANNNKYEDEIDLSFDIYSSGDLFKYGFKERDYKSIVIVLIILGVIGYFYLKKRRK